MIYTIIDIETDGLLDTVSKIHCLSYIRLSSVNGVLDKGSLTDYNLIKEFILQQEILVGHNIIKYDVQVLQKILGINIVSKLIDTLGISWYLYPYRDKHGLESYTEESGIPKPKIEDWSSLDVSTYINRCEYDTEITLWLFMKEMSYLFNLYDGDVDNIIGYISFKMDCLMKQEKCGITLDSKLCQKTLENLNILIEEKIIKLSQAMPKIVSEIAPKNLYKKDGSYSQAAERWFNKLRELRLPLTTDVIYENGNPGSPIQIKDWLFSLGWKPKTYKENKKKEKIPQISLPFGKGLCESVKDLYEVEPNLEELDGLYMLQHRVGLLKSFLNNQKVNGKMVADAHGFTNTMRMQHKVPIVNLPKVEKPYGSEIRACITTTADKILCGCDLSALEDSTKQHYIYFFDPKYVKEMRTEGFDPHLDIGVLAGLITEEESQFYKDFEKGLVEETPENKEKYHSIKKKRGISKNGNFAMTYGALPPKVAETCNIPLKDANMLYDIYWTRNSAIKKAADSCIIKSIGSVKWLFNPISKFWYFLKAEKDKFSTLNQSSGVYVFDTWLKNIYKGIKESGKDINILLQYHDEFLGELPKEDKELMSNIVNKAVKETNQMLKLNIEIGCSIEFGNNYAECH